MHLKKWSLHWNWNPDRPDVAKVLLVHTYLEISTLDPRKLQLRILVSGFELTLSYHYRTFILKNLWFYSLPWLEFFYQDLHRQLVSLKNVFLFQNQILYVQSIISVPPWRKISLCDCASCFSLSLDATENGRQDFFQRDWANWVGVRV